MPWNAPLMLAALKIAPAIMTGNTMVLKASEEAPMAVLEMARICSEVLPAGVLNVLTGYGVECGARIAEHPDIPKVSFTGSTAVGKSILAAASNRIASVSLELGGKSATLRMALLLRCALPVRGNPVQQDQDCFYMSRLRIHFWLH